VDRVDVPGRRWGCNCVCCAHSVTFLEPRTRATCGIGLGKVKEASTLLQEIDTKAVAQFAGFPDWFANVALAQGEIAYLQGDYATARKYVQTAAPIFSRADAEPYQKHALQLLTTAIDKRAAEK
jgi:hypothetical protein